MIKNSSLLLNFSNYYITFLIEKYMSILLSQMGSGVYGVIILPAAVNLKLTMVLKPKQEPATHHWKKMEGIFAYPWKKML